MVVSRFRQLQDLHQSFYDKALLRHHQLVHRLIPNDYFQNAIEHQSFDQQCELVFSCVHLFANHKFDHRVLSHRRNQHHRQRHNRHQ